MKDTTALSRSGGDLDMTTDRIRHDHTRLVAKETYTDIHAYAHERHHDYYSATVLTKLPWLELIELFTCFCRLPS